MDTIIGLFSVAALIAFGFVAGWIVGGIARERRTIIHVPPGESHIRVTLKPKSESVFEITPSPEARDE